MRSVILTERMNELNVFQDIVASGSAVDYDPFSI